MNCVQTRPSQKISLWAKASVATTVALAVAGAQAAAVDVSAVVTDIGAQAVPIGLIGTAVLLIFLAVKAFHWVRRALS